MAELADETGDRAEARRLEEVALAAVMSTAGAPPQLIIVVEAFLAALDAADGDPDGGRDAAAGGGRRCAMADRDMPVLGLAALAGAVRRAAGRAARARRAG